jgi:hypothetical protein
MSSVADFPGGAVKLIEIDQGQLRQHVNGLLTKSRQFEPGATFA